MAAPEENLYSQKYLCILEPRKAKNNTKNNNNNNNNNNHNNNNNNELKININKGILDTY